MQAERINESLEIPAGGHSFYDEKEVTKRLPNYRPYNLSTTSPLTFTDCHLAMQDTIYRAHLIGFEIARENSPFFKRSSRRIILQGDPREFDIFLLSISDRFDDALEIPTIKMFAYQRLFGVLENLLVAHKDYEDSSTIFKRSLLRTEKNFALNVVEPLKKAMINKSKPGFTNLIGQATHCQQEIETACRVWRENAEVVCTKVTATEGWHEATELDKKIESLLDRVQAMGWDRWHDEKIDELNLETVFHRADGPSSVITYLENVLNSAK